MIAPHLGLLSPRDALLAGWARGTLLAQAWHDGLPDSEWCGLGIYDDRVGICCHDLETGVLEAVVDTDSPAAFEWAESAYERYRAEARRLEDAGSLRPWATGGWRTRGRCVRG